jgi:hypothetical protein
MYSQLSTTTARQGFSYGFPAYFKTPDVLLVQIILTNSEEETFQRDKAIANGTKPSSNRSNTEMRHTHLNMLTAIEYANP